MAFSFFDITPHFRACVNSCLKHTGPANTRMDICRTRIFWRGYHTRCTWPRDDQIHLVFCWLKYITVLRIFQSRILHIFVAFGLSISAVFLPKACLNLLFCPLICPLNLPETQYFKLIDIMHNKLEGLQLLPDFCHCYDLVSNEALQKRTALRVIFPCHPAARYKSGKPHGLPLWRRHPDLNRRIGDLQSPALPLGYGAAIFIYRFRRNHYGFAGTGAGNEARTRYLHLGKVALYRMSYARIWCLRPESNWRHTDFQSVALPTELPRHIFFRRTRIITGGNNWTRTSDPLLVRQVL